MDQLNAKVLVNMVPDGRGRTFHILDGRGCDEKEDQCVQASETFEVGTR